MTEILHKELSYAIVGCVFDVHNGVGPGVREECYQKAMEQRLFERGLPFVAKPATRRELIYRGQVVDVFVPDLIVADRIIPELKHQVEGFVPENVCQVLTTNRRMAAVEFQCRNLTVAGEVVVDPVFHERVLPNSPISPLVVNGQVCVQVDAINDAISARVIRTMQTHLRLTGAPIGIVVSFGRNKCSIRGVKP